MGVCLCYKKQKAKSFFMNLPQQNNDIKQPAIVGNNLKTLNELKITISTTAQGAKSNLLIIPGPAPIILGTKLGCTVPEQTECTITSSLSAGNAAGYLELKAYLAQVGLLITYIRLNTSTTSIYDGSLYIGELPPNGIPNPEEITLSDYSKATGGGGYDKTAYIGDRPISNTRNFFMYLSTMPASATLTISLGIANVGNTFTING